MEKYINEPLISEKLEKQYFKADSSGNLIIPAEISSRLGITPGDQIQYIQNGSTLSLNLPMRLDKLYIEVTNKCNLNCRTCIRHVWNEPSGMMSEDIFKAIVSGVSSFPYLPRKAFFGGFGEPLSHPKILEMISRLKSIGMFVELITNGTLLKKR